MNLNIPDKIYKLLVLLGAVLIGYSFYSNDNVEKNYFIRVDQYNDLKDSAAIEEIAIENVRKNFIELAEELSRKHKVQSLVTSTDSTVQFTKVLSGEKNELLVSDSLNSYWQSYLNRKFKFRLLNNKIEAFSKRLDSENKLKEEYFSSYNNMWTIGLIVFFLGLFLWLVDSDQKDKKELIKQNEKLYPFCQSCGKAFSAVRNYGLNKDNTPNYAFCKDCFDHGGFTNPDLTEEEFMKNALNSIKHKNWFSRRTLKVRFWELERWNKNKY